jgi:hypothetical protein
MRMRGVSPALIALMLVAGCARAADRIVPAAAWNPPAWTNENTIELGIVRENHTAHWFKVWVVVLDDRPYVRLGARSAAKLEENLTKPYIGVRVAGQEFPRVRVDNVPADADRVAAAIAKKYWSDILIRLVDHPVTARLQTDTLEP